MIGSDRAAAAVERSADAIRDVARERVRAIHAAESGVTVEGRSYRADEIAGIILGEGMPGVSATYLTYLGRSGSVTVISIVIGWDGAVWAAR